MPKLYTSYLLDVLLYCLAWSLINQIMVFNRLMHLSYIFLAIGIYFSFRKSCQMLKSMNKEMVTCLPSEQYSIQCHNLLLTQAFFLRPVLKEQPQNYKYHFFQLIADLHSTCCRDILNQDRHKGIDECMRSHDMAYPGSR